MTAKRPDLDGLDFLGDGLRGAMQKAWDRYEAIGVSPDPRDLAQRRARAAELARADKVRALGSRGIPTRVAELLLGKELRRSHALSVVEESKAAVLILAGAAGAGRTTAAAKLVVAGEGGRFIRAFDLVKLRADSYVDRQVIAELERVNILAIDDLGTEPADARGFVGMLENLIRRRMDDTVRTVITTPLTKAKFVERYGRRLVEQIARDGHYEEIAGNFDAARAAPPQAETAQLSLVK